MTSCLLTPPAWVSFARASIWAQDAIRWLDVVVRIGAEAETLACAPAEREARVLALLRGRGAPHLLDPSRLERSARRLYGDEF